MLDLETMSNKSTAAIVAIGAVRFDPLGPQLAEPPATVQSLGLTGPYFYVNVDLESSVKAGLTLDADTVYWWMKQPDEARKALEGNKKPLSEALLEFSIWYGVDPKVRLWSHATFDEPILSHAYHVTDLKCPYGYTSARDVRTIYDLAYPGAMVLNVSVTNKHNALWDAWRQAIGVQECYKKLHSVIGA
jgi:hypothetical protein